MGVRNRRYAGAASALLLSVCWAVPGFAQATGDGIVLETIDVSGTRPATATTEETVLTNRVGRDQLDAAQVETIDDIGRLDPGVSFSDSNRSVNIRGLDGSRVLTTIDGIRLPWIEDGARGLQGGLSNFDFNTLSQLDIVKGADSSVFGSGALGGVLAVRTLNPEDLIAPGRNWGGLSKLSADSKDRSVGADQAVAARLNNTFLMLQGGYRLGHESRNQGKVGGFGATRSKQDPSDYDKWNFIAKLRQHVDGGHVFGLTGEMFDRREDIDDRDQATTTYRAGTALTDEVVKRQRVSADYHFEGVGWVDVANAVIYWQRQQLANDFRATRISAPIGDYRRLTEREETTYGVAGSVLKGFRTGGLGHRVSLGGEVFGSKTSSFSRGQDSCGPGPFPPFHNCNFLHSNQADMPETDGTTVGVFVQDEIALSDRVRITPGLRYDWYRQSPQETPGYRDNPNYRGLPAASSDGAFSPKLRAEADIVPGATVYAQWAQAFRAPTANELYMNYGGPGTYLRMGDPDLKPETSNGFEVGAKLGDARFGGSVSGFYNRYKNFIDAVAVTPASVGLPPGLYPFGITQSINRANVEIMGAEAKVHYKHASGWHGWGNVGYYYGRDRDTDVHLNSIPQLKAVVGAGYATAEWGADAIVTAAASRHLAEDAQHRTPSYMLVDLTAWWSPAALKGVTFRAGVYNLFDRTYYDPLNLPDGAFTTPKTYFTEAGRTFRGSMTYKF